MDSILIKLIDFMTDPNSWRACLTGFIAGSALGYMTGMWFSKYRAERLRIFSEERDKNHQRKQQERLEAEEAEAKAAKEERSKAIQDIKKKFEIGPDKWMLVAKDKADRRGFCRKCGFEKGLLVEIGRDNSGALYCPECGFSRLPTHIRPHRW